MKSSIVLPGVLGLVAATGIPTEAAASEKTTLFHVLKAYSEQFNVHFIVKPELQRDLELTVDDISEVDRTVFIETLKINELALETSTEGVLAVVQNSEASDGWGRLL